MNGKTEKQEQEHARWVALGWFYDKAGQRQGPFSTQLIQHQVAAGEISPDVKAFVGWQRGDEIRYLETEIRYALGAAGESATTRSEPTSSASPTVPDQPLDTAPDEGKP